MAVGMRVISNIVGIIIINLYLVPSFLLGMVFVQKSTPSDLLGIDTSIPDWNGTGELVPGSR